MNRKKKDSLGRALIKDRFSKKGRRTNDSFLHTAELNDGYEWARLNLQSVTEEDSFQDFLSTAQLAGTEFQAERLNITFVNPKVGVGLLSKEELKKYEKNKIEKKDLLKIPRRPKWDEKTTTEELQTAERESFLEWRRNLAILQEDEGITLTPYEKNLDFWRQLWRVVERSDVVVQILDGRNPLLFRCEDLEKYVNEVDTEKINVLLLNKSDFLTEEQRRIWARYFDDVGIKIAFFSAKDAALEEVKESDETKDAETTCENNEKLVESDNDENSDGPDNVSEEDSKENNESESDEDSSSYKSCEDGSSLEDNVEELNLNTDKEKEMNSSKLLGREELIEFFRSFTKDFKSVESKGFVTIGLVGYPNVGKSSTINALLADKKVSVSATPGKTKHFQTLYLRKDVMLCDCPGLVMPSFVSTKAEMVLNGILPIDQMRDHVSPTSLLVTLIPRSVIESEYGIMIPKPLEGEDPDRPPTSEELLNSYAYCRGFMTQNGQPDNPRASRYILKDFVTGRLLYCFAPPGIPQEEFHKFKIKNKKPPQLTAQAARAVRVTKVSGDDLDKAFFNKNPKGVHQKGVQKVGPADVKSNVANDGSKPWKNHKEKRNKKEKLRRVYRYLDE
ncbi:large subunit GTPase 1 homolog [Halyomorpha halys]|uniref:large subunit GTPase 1 homolog n=1 Tax=Halyomorpha halys TaxID=286706 RepID=UPI0006D4DD6B|nr:large subunit GTPase 1 homolog [Halyomorpha halys]